MLLLLCGARDRPSSAAIRAEENRLMPRNPLGCG